jgi:dodecin
MTVARVTEISAESPLSFEDAIRHGVDRATKTLRNVKGAWVKEQQVVVDEDKITKFRADLMVTFVLEDEDEDD